MIISPTKALEEGWVFGDDIDSDSIQPNGIDFKLDRVFRLTGHFTLTKTEKMNRYVTELENYNVFPLEVGEYDILTNLKVKLPAEIAATIMIRSSLSRNGLLFGNGLYDSGYEGTVGTVLHAPCKVHIEKGVRIGQIVFHSAQSAYKYNGQYQDNMKYWRENS